MSKQKQIGYIMNLEVLEIGSIKPVASGTFSDKSSGREIKYNGSVSFKTTNIETVEDELLGQKEVESNLVIKVPCTHDNEIKELNEYIRIMQDTLNKKGKPFMIPITLPRQADGNTFKSNCTLEKKDFILMIEKQLKK